MLKLVLPTVIASLAICGGCNRNRDDRDNTNRQGRAVTQPSQAASLATASTDVRILSILHAKNQQEVEIGRLAAEKGASPEVRRYGEMLVRDHSSNDTKVMTVASREGISLIEPARVKESLAKEKGKDPRHDPIAELRDLRGEEFDRRFAEMMTEGHEELIAMVESVRPKVTRTAVANLLDETLPALHHHAEMAMALPANDATARMDMDDDGR